MSSPPPTEAQASPASAEPTSALPAAQDRPAKSVRSALWHALVLLPLACLLLTGLQGIDFGHHWDEAVQTENVERAIDTQTLLPKWYRYPSMLFWMTLGSLAPEVLADLPTNGEEMEATQARLKRVVGSQGFRLRLRTVFLATTCLTVLWTYLATFLWRGRRVESLAAATLVGLSFEVAYHARWVAPDGVLMQFAALALLLLTMAARSGGRTWLYLAAGAAGLGCGTKYTGGILLLPVLTAALQLEGWRPTSQTLRTGLGLVATFVLAFVVTTPGAVLQPFVFYRHVGFEIEHYRTGHYGATIDAGMPHLSAMLRYLATHLFSPYGSVAVLASSLVALGAVTLVRSDRRSALMFLLLPALYLVYMSGQRVMFVRNILLLTPFLAILAARGASAAADALASRGKASGTGYSAVGPALLCGLLWVTNAPFLARAGAGIRDRDTDRDIAAAHAWIVAQDATVYVSRRLAHRFRKLELALPSHATRDRKAEVEFAAFFPTETPSNLQLVANRPGTSVALFGPLDVNFPYYPAWPNPKIVVYPADRARAAGILAPR